MMSLTYKLRFLVDSKENIVPSSNDEIRFLVKGEGRLIGIESGDNRSHNTGHFRHRDSSQAAVKEAYGGLILGYVQASRTIGNITVEISSPGLKGVSLNINPKCPLRTIPSGRKNIR
jgi:hypothetical protein